MARVARTSLPDGYFHVYARAIARAERLFRDDDDFTTFTALVWQSARRHGWTCHAMCLMGTHYHLVLAARQLDLSRGLQRLNWSYARHVNVKYAAFGHVLASRFSARVIEDDDYLAEACAYVLRNPVRAGLCDRVEDWRWSYSSLGLQAA
jgi:REP element-mobilizing transposase RayT